MKKKSRRRKKLIARIKSSGEPLSIYTDGTYRCTCWEPKKYSYWRFEKGKVYYRHKGMSIWNKWVFDGGYEIKVRAAIINKKRV